MGHSKLVEHADWPGRDGGWEREKRRFVKHPIDLSVPSRPGAKRHPWTVLPFWGPRSDGTVPSLTQGLTRSGLWGGVSVSGFGLLKTRTEYRGECAKSTAHDGLQSVGRCTWPFWLPLSVSLGRICTRITGLECEAGNSGPGGLAVRYLGGSVRSRRC